MASALACTSLQAVGIPHGPFLSSGVTSLPQDYGAELSKGCRTRAIESLLLCHDDDTNATETGVEPRPLSASLWVVHSQG